MRLSKDLREFIELLNSHGVEYLIVGAYSLAFHARPRFTGDLDILVRPTPENAEKILGCLREFGFGSSEINAKDFSAGKQIVQLGRAPNRIDLLTSITGVPVQEAFNKKIKGELDGLPVTFLSKDLLIANKRAVSAGCKQLADLKALGE